MSRRRRVHRSCQVQPLETRALLSALSVVGDSEMERDRKTSELTFEVRFQGSSSPFTVEVRTKDGSATVADSDYEPFDRTLQFSGTDGERVQVVVVVRSDFEIEANEDITLQLSNVSHPDVRLLNSAATGTIVNDDVPEGLSFDNGVLGIRAGDDSDVISVERVAGSIRATLNDNELLVAATDVALMLLHANGGDDSIIIGDVAAPAMIRGGGGDDTVTAGLGNDTIYGGSGHDLISANAGHDLVLGGVGNDSILAQHGNDTVSGGGGKDTVHGGSGHDLLTGEAGDDTIKAGTGNDVVHGGEGNDSLAAGRGSDSVSGGAGNDSIAGGAGPDVLAGGSGSDDVRGGRGSDQLGGGSGHDLIAGNSGRDVLVGGWGADTLLGGSGEDALISGIVQTDLRPIVTEWLSSRDNHERILRIRKDSNRSRDLSSYLVGRGRSENQTVFGDTDTDQLHGGADTDYFFATESEDLFNIERGELAEPI